MGFKNLEINTSVFISRLKKGDEKAYDILFHLYYQKLLQVTESYILQREDAEEIVQNVFVKIWEKKSELNINTNISGYLFKMAKNACLDYLKHEKVKLEFKDNYYQSQTNLNPVTAEDTVTAKLAEKELEQKIMRTVEKLPESCKNVFIKSRFEGLKHKEIAQELNISTKTVENHITKALKYIRLDLNRFSTTTF